MIKHEKPEREMLEVKSPEGYQEGAILKSKRDNTV